MVAPVFDHDLGLGERVEDLSVQKLIAELGVEALAIAVLPWASRLDERRLRTDRDDPFSHSLRDELRAIVRPHMSGRTAQNEQVRQNVDDVDRVQLPIDPDRQAFAGEFVDDIQSPVKYVEAIEMADWSASAKI